MKTLAPPLGLASKDFLSIVDLSHAELNQVLELAAALKRERAGGRPGRQPLAGKHVALLFEKPSLRTRSTFMVAVHELGGHVFELPPTAADDREPIGDIARNLERWVAGVVVRTFEQTRVVEFATAAPRLRVVNALTNEEHPCQALADVLTLQEHLGPLPGRTIAYVGDGNNVAVSLTQASVMLGLNVRLASPQGYEIPQEVLDGCTRLARHGATVTLTDDPVAAVAGADAVYTDVWASMGEEAEAEERARIFARFQVNDALMSAAGGSALFMHCLPAHRGAEVTASVIDSPASVVFDQAENRLHAQKALLALLMAS